MYSIEANGGGVVCLLGVQKRRDDWEDVKHADKGVSGCSRQNDPRNDKTHDLGHVARREQKILVPFVLGRGQRALGRLA